MLDYLIKYLRSYFDYKRSRILGGRKDYEKWKEINYSFRTAKIKNKKLAHELEKACKEKGGVFTYGEFLDIEQFGENGYHALHKEHGMTPTYKIWAKPLAAFCKLHDIRNVVEFGFGDGKMAVDLIKHAITIKHTLLWSGVEINNDLKKFTLSKFKSNRLGDYIQTVADSIHNLKIYPKSLVIFSYSLDSIPPEIFVNNNLKKGLPDSMIGIIIKDSMLQEVILSKTQLQKKGIDLKNGTLTCNNLKFDLSSWNLQKGQRAYIPIRSFKTIVNVAKQLDKSSYILIIDEFRPTSSPWETNHLCVPRDLHTFLRDVENIEFSYETASDNLWYYPIYIESMISLLKSCGFQDVKYDSELDFVEKFQGKKPKPRIFISLCHAILATNKSQANPVITITFPRISMLNTVKYPV